MSAAGQVGDAAGAMVMVTVGSVLDGQAWFGGVTAGVIDECRGALRGGGRTTLLPSSADLVTGGWTPW